MLANLGAQTSDWRVWASYIVSTSSPYGDLLTNRVYNKAVVLHVTSDSWDWGGVPAVYRVRVLQSGETFRWVRRRHHVMSLWQACAVGGRDGGRPRARGSVGG